MKENLKLTCFLTIFIPAFLFADRAPQDTWYLDRELKLPEMPGFKNPRGITFGPSGHSYVTDMGNHAITIWDQNGSMIKRFGTHGSGDGQFSHPVDIAVTNDEIYVVEKDNHRVQVFDINGSFLRKWGSHGSGDTQFNQPFSISLDMNGTMVNEVFIADRYNYKAKVFDANGTFKRTIGSGMISESTGISFGPDGLLYLSSCRANKIEVFETNGTHVRTFSTTMNPYHIDFYGDKLAVSAYDNHKLEVFDKNGTSLSVVGSYGNDLGLFNHALGVAFDSLGNLHVADTNNHRIQVLDSNYSHLRSYGVWGSGVLYPYDFHITPEITFLITDYNHHRVFEVDNNGTYLRTIASYGGGDGQINAPRGVHLGTDNRIYVADTGSHRVQIFDRNGTFIRKFGSSGSGDGQFNQPYGVVTSNTGEIFVVERYNHRVQAFDSNGTFLRKFGSNGSLEGQMNQPHDITISDQGNLMVADFYNRRIVHFTTAGEFLKHPTVSDHPEHIANLSNGLLGTSRDNRVELYDENSDRLKIWYKPGGGTSAIGSMPNGTIVCLNRNNDSILFYKPTYRTVRRNDSLEIPLPEVLSVVQPDNSNNLQVTYRINDADSTHVSARILGFVDGGNDLSKVIIPTSFIGSTVGKLDDNVTTNQEHNITWNVGADWSVGFGELEVAIMAKDDRNLLNLHFLTLPGNDGNSTELKINRSPITDTDLLDLWYWLLATGDSGIQLNGTSITPVLTGSAPSFTPSQINDAVLWLDANNVDGQSNNIASGSAIQSWTNLVDSDHNFTQTNESKQPSLINNVLNGKPGVFFDDELDGMSSTVQINSTPYTVIALFNCLDSSSRSRRAVQGSHNWLIGPHSGRVGFHTSHGWVSHIESLIANKFYLCIASADSSSSSFTVNGKDVTQNSNSRYQPNYLHLGGSGGHSSEDLNGYICEVMAYSRKLDSSEILQFETYFKYKWNIVPSFVDGTSTSSSGRAYLFDKMNLREATQGEVDRAKNGAISGTINQFTPALKVGPDERPNKVNEYGFDTGSTTGVWVTPR